MIPIFIATALAATDPHAASLVPEAARRLGHIHLSLGGVEADVGPGTVLPVRADGLTIGVAFVADGSLSLTFPDPADALRFGNRQVLLGGRPKSALAAVAHGEAPFTTRISRGFYFGAEAALSEWLAGEPADGSIAASSLEARLALLDRTEDLRRGTFADLLGADRLWTVRQGGQAVEEDAWISVLTRSIDGRPQSTVRAIGQRPDGEPVEHTLSLQPWGSPAELAPLPLRPLHAEVRILTEASRASTVVQAEIDATITLLPSASLSEIEIELPRVEASKGSWGGAPDLGGRRRASRS